MIQPESAIPIPEGIEAAKVAPILCAGVTMFNSLRHMNVQPGETVAIQGLGGLGHLGIQYAKRMGYRVIAISRGADKEAAARRLGAHEYIDSEQGDPGLKLRELGGAALIATTAPSAKAIEPLLKGAGVLGKVLILSVPGPVSVDTFTMLGHGVSVQVWPGGHSGDSRDSVAFTLEQGIECEVQTFPLSEAQSAYGEWLPFAT